MKLLFALAFLLLFFTPVLGQLYVQTCLESFNPLDANWAQAESHNFPPQMVSSLFDLSQKCANDCANEQIASGNSDLAIECNDRAKFLVNKFNLKGGNADNLAFSFLLDTNSLALAQRKEDESLIRERLEIAGDSSKAVGMELVCGDDPNCAYFFTDKLKELNAQDTFLAMGSFRYAINKYYDVQDYNSVKDTFLLFNKTRRAYQSKDLNEKLSLSSDGALALVWPIFVSTFPWIVLAIIVMMVSSWYFRKKSLPRFMGAFSEIHASFIKDKFEFESKDFVILLATLWIGTTFGFGLGSDIDNTTIQVLSNPSPDAIVELVNLPYLDQLALISSIHHQLWWLSLIGLFFGLLWLFSGKMGYVRSAGALKMFSYIFLAFFFLMILLALGLATLFFGAVYLVLVLFTYELITFVWEKVLTKKTYIKGGMGTLHDPVCKSIHKMKNQIKVELMDNQLSKFKLCKRCLKKKKSDVNE